MAPYPSYFLVHRAHLFKKCNSHNEKSYGCPHLLYDLILILYLAHFSIDYSSTLTSTTHLENNELVLW